MVAIVQYSNIGSLFDDRNVIPPETAIDYCLWRLALDYVSSTNGLTRQTFSATSFVAISNEVLGCCSGKVT